MTRIRILITHAGETFDYDADLDQAISVTSTDLGPLIDQAVDVVKRAIGITTPTEGDT